MPESVENPNDLLRTVAGELTKAVDAIGELQFTVGQLSIHLRLALYAANLEADHVRREEIHEVHDKIDGGWVPEGIPIERIGAYLQAEEAGEAPATYIERLRNHTV